MHVSTHTLYKDDGVVGHSAMQSCNVPPGHPGDGGEEVGVELGVVDGVGTGVGSGKLGFVDPIGPVLMLPTV